MGLTEERDLQEELIVIVAGTPQPEKPKFVSVPGNTSNGKEAAESNESERDDHKDLESQQTGDTDGEKGWISMCRRQQRDVRLMVAPRFMDIHAFCTRSRANRILTLYTEVRRAKGAGEDVAELSKKLEEEIAGYDQHMHQTNQILALNQPNNLFLRHLLGFFKSTLEDENISFFDEPINDWVSLSQHDRLDQLICLVPLHKIGRAVFKPFLAEIETVGDNRLYHYHEHRIRGIIFTVFLCIIAVFTCAPAAIQSLNVESAAGEVAVYLVFVIAFGWLSQGLIQGFEKLLLTSLAFAGLMANLLRGDK
ncbi:uncharacterized protein FTOL_04153 [Fusarium torulosum]|uniref:DUF6594 domain-containing protein n=1 Tax=Fusarium torulosum TaxID=33205 RepID=A0AAE8M5A2_9HYPO|nr:uncharacterized protein FTOL_04153 [Fusarium torulosum]